MILSNECYCQDGCKKYRENNCPTNPPVFCHKLFKINYLFDESLLSLNQRKRIPLRIDADGTDHNEFIILKKIEDNIVAFVDGGYNLYIHSSTCGNGKTLWATRLIQDYINAIWHKSTLTCRAMFISVPRFLLALKDNITDKSDYVDHIKKNVLDADLVVWDEVGVSNLTKFEHEHLLNLINTRLDYNKSNIYTSNMGPDDLAEKLGERLYSRIVNLSTDIEFHGADKRGVR